MWKRTIAAASFATVIVASLAVPAASEMGGRYTKPPFVAAVLATKPLAYFRLEGAKGSSETGHTSYSSVGGVSTATPGAPIGVKSNSCVVLNGSDSYIAT